MKISKSELEKAFNKAKSVHAQHLKGDGVKLPTWGSAKAYWLAILFHAYENKSGFVSKDTISEIVRQHLPDAAHDQQVRHLKRDGWNLRDDGAGGHCFADIYTPHAGFARDQMRSQKALLAGDFNGIKEAYGHKCATCGAIEGEPDPRYTGAAVKLQQGHKDPEKPLDIKNVIPQCQFCNRAYKDDFVFDKKGRAHAVASTRPVKRASKAVKAKIAEMLKNENKSD